MISLTRIITGHHYRSNNYRVIHHIHIAHTKSEMLYRFFDYTIEFISEMFEFQKHNESDAYTNTTDTRDHIEP
jgi:hypothetical protein